MDQLVLPNVFVERSSFHCRLRFILQAHPAGFPLSSFLDIYAAQFGPLTIAPEGSGVPLESLIQSVEYVEIKANIDGIKHLQWKERELDNLLPAAQGRNQAPMGRQQFARVTQVDLSCYIVVFQSFGVTRLLSKSPMPILAGISSQDDTRCDLYRHHDSGHVRLVCTIRTIAQDNCVDSRYEFLVFDFSRALELTGIFTREQGHSSAVIMFREHEVTWNLEIVFHLTDWQELDRKLTLLAVEGILPSKDRTIFRCMELNDVLEFESAPCLDNEMFDEFITRLKLQKQGRNEEWSD